MLAGDYGGDRILKAASLVRDGFAPRVYVSGPSSAYGHNEADLAIEFAVQRGFPASYFAPVRHEAHSTREEAVNLWHHLEQNGVRQFIVVTSDFHTRRSGRIYRAVAPQAKVLLVAAPTPEFSPSTWWHKRQARKVWYTEWQKTVADWFGI